jgi:hypothetical protein
MICALFLLAPGFCFPQISFGLSENQKKNPIDFEIFYEYGTDVVMLNLITSVPGGVNIYRNGEFIDFLPGSYQTYVDEGVPPGNHEYCLTDTYSRIHPDTTCHWVQVRYGHRLPFAETWDSASFESNNWGPFGWTINLNTGQPEPSAEMPWDFRTAYSSQLQSHYINADSVFVGDIYITFSYMLDNVVATGTEKLSLEIWDMETGNWSEPLWEVDNGEGSIAWNDTTLHLDLLGTVFAVRFNASGENAVNILGWYVDNIHIYRSCNPPNNVECEVLSSYEEIKVSWEPPVGWPFSGPVQKSGRDDVTVADQHKSNDSQLSVTNFTHYYKVYRSINYDPFEWIGTANPTDNEYIDDELPEPPDGTYLYKVKAVYTEESDTCISELSNEAWTSIGPSSSHSLQGAICSISPNPASDKIMVRIDQETSFSFTNLAGKVLMTGNLEPGISMLNLSSIKDGIYLLKTWNENASGCQKIIIKHK